MKRLAKPISVIIILVLLLFSAVSLLGISYYEGDFRRVPIKGFGDIDWGIDVSGGVRVTLSPSTADEADLDTVKEAASVVEKRAAAYGLVDYDLYVNAPKKAMVLTIPNSINSEYSAEEIADILTSVGNLTLRPGEEFRTGLYDSSNSLVYAFPGGDTAKEVILSSEDVESSTWYSYSEGNATYYYVAVQYNSEAAELLKTVSNPSTGRFYNQTVSLWLDNRMLANPKVSEEIVGGSLQFSGMDFTESKVKLYSAVIGSGTLPEGLTVSYDKVEPTVGKNAADIMLYVGIAAAVILAVFMVYKYRTVGAVAIIMALFELSALVAIITGFCFGGNSTFLMTVPGAAALALSVMLTVISMIIIAERIKYQLENGNPIGVSVSEGLKKSFKNILDINIILMIISLIGMFLFSTAGLIIGIFGGGATGGIYNFCFVLFFGALLNFLAGYILPNIVLRSLYSFKALSKPSVFGGAKK